MTPRQVIEHFGNRAEVAKALRVTYEAVRQWEKAGKVPAARQFQIQVVTCDKLIADSSAA